LKTSTYLEVNQRNQRERASETTKKNKPEKGTRHTEKAAGVGAGAGEGTGAEVEVIEAKEVDGRVGIQFTQMIRTGNIDANTKSLPGSIGNVMTREGNKTGICLMQVIGLLKTNFIKVSTEYSLKPVTKVEHQLRSKSNMLILCLRKQISTFSISTTSTQRYSSSYNMSRRLTQRKPMKLYG
jgi:hypothetical protein